MHVASYSMPGSKSEKERPGEEVPSGVPRNTPRTVMISLPRSKRRRLSVDNHSEPSGIRTDVVDI